MYGKKHCSIVQIDYDHNSTTTNTKMVVVGLYLTQKPGQHIQIQIHNYKNTQIDEMLSPDTEAELLRRTFPISPGFGFVERPRGCNRFSYIMSLLAANKNKRYGRPDVC